MKTVKEVSQLTGVSVRTLHYYDQIGLLPPTSVTDAGYRLYDDKALFSLQEILLFRELEIPLKHIAPLLTADKFEKEKALKKQLRILELKRNHLQELMELTQSLIKGDRKMTFSPFNHEELVALEAEAREKWGQTDTYRAFSEKTRGKDTTAMGLEMMTIFEEFAPHLKSPVTDPAVQNLVKKLQDYISEHFYPCTNDILSGLGLMYAEDNRFKENIDKKAGSGVSLFVSKAIASYVSK